MQTRIANMFARFDSNSDGQVTWPEASAQSVELYKSVGLPDTKAETMTEVLVRKLYDAVDRDGSAGVSKDEFATGMRDAIRGLAGSPQATGADAAIEWFKSSDQDGSSSLTLNELVGGIGRSLARDHVGGTGPDAVWNEYIIASGTGFLAQAALGLGLNGELTLDAFKDIFAEVQA